MKKRLRKKLHKGEFQELGFNLTFDYAKADNEELFDKFFDSFIAEAIEGNGLECGGGGYFHQDFFVVRYKGSVIKSRQRRRLKSPQITQIYTDF